LTQFKTTKTLTLLTVSIWKILVCGLVNRTKDLLNSIFQKRRESKNCGRASVKPSELARSMNLSG
jgi:hypothetical protein